MKRHLRLALAIATFSIAAPALASGPRYTVVHYLTAQTKQPAGIVEGSPGVFYSSSASVAIFSVTAKGQATVLASFADPPYTVGSAPGAMAVNGLLYSSVQQAGSGNIFSVGSTPGTMTTYPASGLAIWLTGNLPNGSLFGAAGSQSGNIFYIVSVDTSGNATTFYTFPSTDRTPYNPIYARDGNYYGVVQPYASVPADFYKVTPSGSSTTVATLPFFVANFTGGGLVLQGTDDNFYGIQSTGLGCNTGNQHGGVYKLTPSGQYTLLHDFGVCGNGIVNSLIEGSDGKFYGAIEGDSELFSLTKSGDYKVLFTPSNGTTQGLCPCSLVQGSDGKIYGIAAGGGPGGFGVFFALDAGLPTPKPQALRLSPEEGAVGTQVTIWGYNLFGASVTFNRVAATTISNSGPNYVLATVPAGATTGPVTVTTPGGTSTLRATFHVK